MSIVQMTCPGCGQRSRVPEAEVNRGVRCPSCGDYMEYHATDAAATAAASRWSVPADMSLWPTVRWLLQLVSGAILVLVFSALVVAIPFGKISAGARLGVELFIAALTGLPLAAAVNGFLVGTRRRRLTALGVFALIVIAMAFGAILWLGIVLLFG